MAKTKRKKTTGTPGALQEIDNYLLDELTDFFKNIPVSKEDVVAGKMDFLDSHSRNSEKQ